MKDPDWKQIEVIHNCFRNQLYEKMTKLIDSYGTIFWNHYKRWLYSEQCLDSAFNHLGCVVSAYADIIGEE